MSETVADHFSHGSKHESHHEIKKTPSNLKVNVNEGVISEHAYSKEENHAGVSGPNGRAPRRKIVLLASALIGPMLVFTCVFIWLIFGHLVNPNGCLHQELCLSEAQLNPAIKDTEYVVDFPAAQLVFIASWSSTFSFALIGFSMTLYSYIVASKWLDFVHSDSSRQLPTPYQTSVLMRVINSEPLVLLGLFWKKFIGAFQHLSKHKFKDTRSSESNTPSIVRNGIAVFVTFAIASVLIQAADTYLHIVTDAVNFNEVQPETAGTHLYSRGLSQSCLERPTYGDFGNPNYWSCGMNRFGRIKTIGPVGFSEIQAVSSGISRDHDVWQHTDKSSGLRTSVVTPKNANFTVDFRATSFGVTTQCRPIYIKQCQQKPSGNLTRFECNKYQGGVDMNFTMFRIKYQAYYHSWHKFIKEPEPFIGREAYQATEKMFDEAANLTDAEASDIFSNPWQSLIQLNINSPIVDRNSDGIFYEDKLGSSSVLFLNCNTTVFDVDYTAVQRNITSIKRTPSNSSTTGIVSMTTLTMWKFWSSTGSILVDDLNYLTQTEDNVVDLYASKISERYAAVIAAQTSPRSALLVQRRVSKVFSKIPKAAVWLQLMTNILFMVLAVVISVAAFMRAKGSPEVHQAQIRLSIMGLAAHAFEGSYAMRMVQNDDDLFEERDGQPGRLVKRVALEDCIGGGATFVLREGWEERN